MASDRGTPEMRCPACTTALETVREGRILTFLCPDCGGRALTLGALRRLMPRENVEELWWSLRGSGEPGDRKCADCTRAMLRVRRGPEVSTLELDVCAACQIVWFDPGELARFAPMGLDDHVDPEEDPECKALRDAIYRSAAWAKLDPVSRAELDRVRPVQLSRHPQGAFKEALWTHVSDATSGGGHAPNDVLLWWLILGF